MTTRVPSGSSDALVHRRYAPEDRELDPTATHEANGRTLSWLELPKLGTSPWVSPYEQIRTGGAGVIYSMARVRVAEPRTVAFKVWCDSSFRIVVNGDAVVTADREGEFVPSPVWCTARLEAGWNRVVVKMAGRDNFALKLTDPASGEPLHDIEVGDPLLTDDVPATTGAAEERSYQTPRERAVAAAESGGPLHQAAAAALLARDELGWDTYSMWERAGAAAVVLPNVAKANLLAAHGRFLAEFSGLPQVQRKLRAKARYEEAVDAFAGHNSASVRIARYQNEDDHPDEAVNALNTLLAERPTAFGWMAVAEICRGRDWEKESIEAANAALELSPNLSSAVRFLADLDRKYGNHEALRVSLERRVAIDASDTGALAGLVGIMRDKGEHDAALASLRQLVDRWPESLGYRRQIADVLADLGRYDESAAGWRELEALVPQESVYPRSLAEVLEIMGDRDGARAAYDRSLDLSGYQPQTWRAVKRLSAQKEDFAKRYEPNVDELLAALPSDDELREKYPKAVAVTVLDHSVTQLRADGSASSIVHMAYKLLDEKAVQKYGDVGNAGELLDIRAILPDGTVMKPTGLNRRSYNMEGLVPGTVIVHRHLSHQRATRQGYDGGQFFFQDYDFRGDPNPVLKSRWVVLAPEGMKVPHKHRNGMAEPVVETADGWTSTIWEMSDMPRIEWEQGMPEKEEIVPYVDYSPAPDAGDANWEFLSRQDDSRSTPIVADALSGIVNGEMNDTQKLHAIHAFVNAEITGDFGSGSGPSSTLLEKAGDRGELFESFVRAAGVPYRLGRAMSWRGHSLDLTRPVGELFRGSFLWLEPRGGEPVAYFSGARQTPFGLVPPSYRGSFAFLASARGGEIIELDAGGPNTTNGVLFEVTLGEKATDTRVQGTVNYRAAFGYRWKRQLTETPQDDRRKFAEGQLTNYFGGATLESFELPGLETPGESMVIRLTGTMPQFLTEQGGRYVASLNLPASGATGRFIHRPERTYDQIISVRDDGVDEIIVHLGDAFEVAHLPEDHLAIHELGTYSLTWRLDGKTLSIRRERHLQPARYSADQYQGFVDWCKQIDDAEERKIEFRTIE